MFGQLLAMDHTVGSSRETTSIGHVCTTHLRHMQSRIGASTMLPHSDPETDPTQHRFTPQCAIPIVGQAPANTLLPPIYTNEQSRSLPNTSPKLIPGWAIIAASSTNLHALTICDKRDKTHPPINICQHCNNQHTPPCSTNVEPRICIEPGRTMTNQRPTS